MTGANVTKAVIGDDSYFKTMSRYAMLHIATYKAAITLYKPAFD